MFFYLNLFFIYAIGGYFYETLCMTLLNKSYNSSVLYGPWTPVYGIALYFMIANYLLIKKFNLNKRKEIILYFISITIILTLLEDLSGYIIQFTQNKIYWDYKGLKFNLGHYIALEVSLIWGFFSTLSVYIILPKIKKIVNKIPKELTLTLLVLFIIAIIISLIT